MNQTTEIVNDPIDDPVLWDLVWLMTGRRSVDLGVILEIARFVAVMPEGDRQRVRRAVELLQRDDEAARTRKEDGA